MKKILFSILSLLLLTATLSLAASDTADYYPKGEKIVTRPMIASLQYNPKVQNRTSIIISATETIKYTAFKREDAAGGLQLVLDIENMELGNFVKPILLYKYPVTIIKPEYFIEDKTSRIIFSLKEDAEYEITREGNERIILNFVVPEKQPELLNEVVEDTKKYKGEPISVDFEKADLVQILRFLTDLSNKNVLISPNVTGTFSISLKKPLPWDQVLDIILAANNLEMEQDDNIMTIKTIAEFQAERTSKAAAAATKALMQKQQSDSAELITYLMPVSYANIEALKAQLESLKGANGILQTDVNTNQIIITDTVQNINRMKELTQKLDVKTKQVSIEVRLVNIATTDSSSLGFNWTVAGPLGIIGERGLDQATITTQSTATYLTATLTPHQAFAATTAITALETKNKAKTISNPKVIASDNQSAKITNGQSKQVNVTTTSNGVNTVTTETITAILSLTVTPHVTLDGHVKLKLDVSNDSFVSSTSPDVNTQTITTDLYVKDGFTAVMGGIFKNTGTDDKKGIPMLSSIPVLGYLFGATTNDATSTELMIFVTPKVLEQQEL